MRESPENLGETMARGTVWVAASSYIGFVISFATGIVLARMIEPAVFGLFAFGVAIVGLMQMVAGIGYPDFLIRRDEIDEEAVQTVLSVSLVLGLTVILLWAVASPFMGFFGSADLVILTGILALAAVVSFAGEVPHALLQRKFALKRVAMIQLVVGIVVCGATLLTVLLGGELSALVVNGVGATLLTSMCYFVAMPRRWGAWKWNQAIVRELALKAKSFLGTGVIMTLTGQLDKLFMGVMLPEAQLGFYNRGQRMSGLFSVIVPTAVTRAVLPAFSAVRGDRPKLIFTYDLLMSLHLLVLCPVGVGLYFAAEPLIELLYSAKWLAAAPVLRVFVVMVVLTPLVGIWMLLQIALNHAERVARARAIGLALFLPALWWGLNHAGIVGAAWAVVLFEFVSFLVLGVYTSRILGLGVTMRPLLPHVFCVLVSFVPVVWVTGLMAGGGAGLLLELVVIGMTTAVVYGVAMLLVDRRRMFEAVGYLFKKLGFSKRASAG